MPLNRHVTESNVPPGTVYIVIDKTGGTGTTCKISVQ
jgi:hypothetical protein